ncbi:MAG: hypothetical protein KAJ19_24735, partial [Gammaproteobacteria bacterium]|nr:hypothetical protein [Gammaproteobacteria bacterium]
MRNGHRLELDKRHATQTRADWHKPWIRMMQSYGFLGHWPDGDWHGTVPRWLRDRTADAQRALGLRSTSAELVLSPLTTSAVSDIENTAPLIDLVKVVNEFLVYMGYSEDTQVIEHEFERLRGEILGVHPHHEGDQNGIVSTIVGQLYCNESICYHPVNNTNGPWCIGCALPFAIMPQLPSWRLVLLMLPVLPKDIDFVPQWFAVPNRNTFPLDLERGDNACVKHGFRDFIDEGIFVLYLTNSQTLVNVYTVLLEAVAWFSDLTVAASILIVVTLLWIVWIVAWVIAVLGLGDTWLILMSWLIDGVVLFYQELHKWNHEFIYRLGGTFTLEMAAQPDTVNCWWWGITGMPGGLAFIIVIVVVVMYLTLNIGILILQPLLLMVVWLLKTVMNIALRTTTAIFVRKKPEIVDADFGNSYMTKDVEQAIMRRVTVDAHAYREKLQGTVEAEERERELMAIAMQSAGRQLQHQRATETAHRKKEDGFTPDADVARVEYGGVVQR